ncbi:MAG: death-on-curing protein [Melioribacteraceae bacterium]|nr:MAG: death-on-curing protein [Melioribacteraceae bacterium]
MSIADVIYIHGELIKEFGGSDGIRDKNQLDAAVMRPQSGYYITLIEEASAMMESLAMNHCFIDGNKRIAFFATDTFLRMNGYNISCDTEEGHKFFVNHLEANNFRFEIIKNWLEEKVVELK